MGDGPRPGGADGPGRPAPERRRLPSPRTGRARIARRELGSLGREKTIVLAILVQLFIAAFSSFLVVGLVSLYDPTSVSSTGGVTFGVTGDADEELAEVLRAEGRWRVIRYGDLDRAMGSFSRGRVDAVLATVRNPAGNVTVEATVPDGSLRTTLIVVQVREALSTYERARRVALDDRLHREPIPAVPANDGGPFFGFTYTVLLPLLMLLPAFISGSVAADAVIEEHERGTIDLLRAAPVSLAAIVDGKLLAALSLAPIQAGAWLLLLSVNGAPVSHPLPILAIVVAATTVIGTYGAALGLVLVDRRSVQFLYSVGVVVLFTGTYLLPQSPANAIARLAVGHPSHGSWSLVAGSLLAAGIAYVLLRGVVATADQ